MLINRAGIFAPIMNEVSEQHLLGSSFYFCGKVRICTGSIIYLERRIKPKATFVLHIEGHENSS